MVGSLGAGLCGRVGLMRVAVVAGPDPGHAFPAIALCRRFLAAGDAPTLFTGTEWLDGARSVGIDAVELDGLDPTELDDDTDAGAKIHQRAARMAVINAPHLRALAPDLVVSDVITACGGLAAEVLGMPWIHAHPPVAPPQRPPARAGGAPPGLAGGGRRGGPAALRTDRHGARGSAGSRRGVGRRAVDGPDRDSGSGRGGAGGPDSGAGAARGFAGGGVAAEWTGCGGAAVGGGGPGPPG